MIKSISIKLWLLIVGFTLIVLAIGIVIFAVLFRSYLYHAITSKMINEGNAISRLYYQSTDQAQFMDQVEQLRNVLGEEIIVTSNSRLLAGCIPFEQASSDMLITAEERSRLVGGEVVVHKGYHPRFDKQILAVVIPLFQNDRMTGAVFLASPLADVLENIGEVQHLVIYGGLIAVIVAVLIGFFLSKRLSGPLIYMENVARKMATGDYEHTLTVRSKDEIGRLTLSLNRLSTALAQQEQRQREFVANVSHELRTPLTFLQGYSEIILDGVDNIEDKKDYLSIILQETKRLRRLVDDLLELSRLDSGQHVASRAPVDWAQVVMRVIGNLRPIAQEKGIKLDGLVPEGLPSIWGNEDQMERILINLLDNALRITPAGGDIEVFVALESDKMVTKVADTGPGIPAQDLPLIWERFYKVDKSRTGKSGTGLGLAIVKSIIQSHGGQIDVTSMEGKGTTFTFTIPLYQEYNHSITNN